MFSFVQWKPEAAGLKTESENRKEQMKTHSALLGGGDLLCDSARNAFQTLQKHDAAVCCSFRALASTQVMSCRSIMPALQVRQQLSYITSRNTSCFLGGHSSAGALSRDPTSDRKLAQRSSDFFFCVASSSSPPCGGSARSLPSSSDFLRFLL